MYIPPLDDLVANGHLEPIWSVLAESKDKLSNAGWSSLIGVVTAICGNILISFALNTQRYAHLRLSRDRREKLVEEKRKRAQRRGEGRSEGLEEIGRQQNGKKEVNGKKELNGNGSDKRPQHEARETDPLIPKSTDSASSDRTIRQEDQEPELDQDQDSDDESVTGKEKSYLSSPIWWVGIIMMVLGEAGNFLAYGFAPASIVSPLGVVALVSNCLIAPLLLGEKFRIRDGLGVLISIAGAVVVVLSASDSNPKLTPDAIWALVTTWQFETYLGVTSFLIIVLVFLSNKYGERTILIDLGLVGLFGGYTALSTKGVASLLTYKIWRVITFPITYVLLAVLVFTAVMQIKYLNRALQHFNATVVIPTQFVLFTISVIVGSAILYQDFDRESPEDAGKFVGGCALTFFGVWCITSGRSSEPADGSDEEDEDDTSLADEGDIIIPEIRENDEPHRQMSIATASSHGLRRLHTTDGGSLPRSLHTSGMEQNTPPVITDLNKHLQDADLPPATASAVHGESTAPMHGTQDDGEPQKPPFHATTSAPVIPTTPRASEDFLRPITPFGQTPSGTDLDRASPKRRTPGNRTKSQLDPHDRPRLLERNSIMGLFPGPLTSPLSGSLSAIVADEIRRGVERSPLRSLRRKSTRRRPSDATKAAPFNGTLKRHSIASGTEADFERESADDASEEVGRSGSGVGRMRSLSATLGDLFRSGSVSGSSLKRQRTLERDRERNKKVATNDRSLEEGRDEDVSRR